MRAMFRTALLAALLCLTANIANAFTHVGDHIGSAFSGTTITITSLTPTAGNSYRVILWATPTTMTLTSVACGSTTGTNGATNAGTQKFMALAEIANLPGTTCSLVVTLSGGPCTDCRVLAQEWSGDAASNPLDQSAVTEVLLGSSAGLSISPPSVTTTVNGDDLWCPMAQLQNVAPTSATGWSAFNYSTAPWWTVDQVQTSFGATNGLYPCYTSGASSFDNEIGIMALKPAAGAVAPNPARSLFIHPGPF